MNWIANVCYATERALVDYIRLCTVPGLENDRIYAGLAHASADTPSDLAVAEYDPERQVEGDISLDTLPTDDETILTPNVKVICDSAQAVEGFINGEVMIVDVSIQVTSHSDDLSGSQHNDLAGRVFDLICDPLFADKCSEASSTFTVNGREIVSQGYQLDGHNWISRMTFKMQCCAADI